MEAIWAAFDGGCTFLIGKGLKDYSQAQQSRRSYGQSNVACASWDGDTLASNRCPFHFLSFTNSGRTSLASQPMGRNRTATSPRIREIIPKPDHITCHSSAIHDGLIISLCPSRLKSPPCHFRHRSIDPSLQRLRERGVHLPVVGKCISTSMVRG